MSKFVKDFWKGLDRFSKKFIVIQIVTFIMVLIVINVTPEIEIFISEQSFLMQLALLGLFESISYYITDKWLIQ